MTGASDQYSGNGAHCDWMMVEPGESVTVEALLNKLAG